MYIRSKYRYMHRCTVAPACIDICAYIHIHTHTYTHSTHTVHIYVINKTLSSPNHTERMALVPPFNAPF